MRGIMGLRLKPQFDEVVPTYTLYCIKDSIQAGNPAMSEGWLFLEKYQNAWPHMSCLIQHNALAFLF